MGRPHPQLAKVEQFAAKLLVDDTAMAEKSTCHFLLLLKPLYRNQLSQVIVVRNISLGEV